MEENIEKKACPFCGEEIMASAKKCKFCGEWLEKKSEQKETKKEVKKEKTPSGQTVELSSRNILLIVGIIAVVIIAAILIFSFLSYVPGCKSVTMQDKLREYLVANYQDVGEIVLNKDSAYKVKKFERGYSCSIDANIDQTPTKIDYMYKKVAFNEYDVTAKFVLPNCYDSSVKNILQKQIKEYDYYDIKNNTSNVSTNYEVQNNHVEDPETYTCTAEATLTSKPGRAFLLNDWSYDDATRQIKCKVDYRTFFCKNGYATCVGLNDIYACEYKDD